MSNVQERIKTSDKVIHSLKEQGRKKIWLASELGITRQTLNTRLSDNCFTTGEILKLRKLGMI